MCEKCDCCHVPDYGACDMFERGLNGRCFCCDHAEECHPGEGIWFNMPLQAGQRRTAAGEGRGGDRDEAA